MPLMPAFKYFCKYCQFIYCIYMFTLLDTHVVHLALSTDVSVQASIDQAIALEGGGGQPGHKSVSQMISVAVAADHTC